jgi:hypothetical protein
MNTPILARDLKPGDRASIDPDGAGRVVTRTGKGRNGGVSYVYIRWADGCDGYFSPKDTFYLIHSPEAA